MSSKHNIFIVAGEPSGDLQASLLIDEFLKIAPNTHFWGFGGEKMRNAGAETVADISELAVMGLFDVVKHIPRLKRLMRMSLAEVDMRKPAGAILVDYPGFNLSIAQKLNARDIKVGYYISPQFWAWGERRVEKVRKFVDRMVCILPFEKEFYASHDIDVDYVGHPFVDTVVPETSEDEFRKFTQIGDADFVALLPGSRKKEIVRILPKMLEAFKIVREKHPSLFAVVAAAQGIENFLKESLPADGRIKLVGGMTYSALKYARGGIIASGSATLEAMISMLPSVVMYRIDPLSWHIGKTMIKSPHIALSNIVAGERIFPEFIQKIDPKKIADEVEKILFDNAQRKQMLQKMSAAVKKLGTGGAAKNAAEIFHNLFL